MDLEGHTLQTSHHRDGNTEVPKGSQTCSKCPVSQPQDSAVSSQCPPSRAPSPARGGLFAPVTGRALATVAARMTIMPSQLACVCCTSSVLLTLGTLSMFNFWMPRRQIAQPFFEEHRKLKVSGPQRGVVILPPAGHIHGQFWSGGRGFTFCT